MRKNFKTGILLTVTVALVTLAGCTSTDTPDPNQNGNEVTEVVNAYKDVVNTTYNHNKTAGDLETVNTEMIKSLGNDGTNYKAALDVLTPIVNLDKVYVVDDVTGIPQFKAAKDVFNVMLSNTANDVVSVDVDSNKVTLDDTGSSANIAYNGVTFTSEKNETTGLADSLNEKYKNAENGIRLILTENGWKVDMDTFSPPTAPVE